MALQCRDTGFNVFSYGLCMKGTVKETLGYINQPIVIGGIAVAARGHRQRPTTTESS